MTGGSRERSSMDCGSVGVSCPSVVRLRAIRRKRLRAGFMGMFMAGA